MTIFADSDFVIPLITLVGSKILSAKIAIDSYAFHDIIFEYNYEITLLHRLFFFNQGFAYKDKLVISY